MILYHGSDIGSIEMLKPQQADHNRPYVYLTANQIVAGFYMVHLVERPSYWYPYGFDRDGNVQYHELYPNAFEEGYKGRAGFLYTVDAAQEDTAALRQIPGVKMGTAPLKVVSSVAIEDCYQWLMRRERNGEWKLCKYEDKSDRELQNWYGMIADDLKEKNMIHTPACSYAGFVRQKFPTVWEQYVRESRQ